MQTIDFSTLFNSGGYSLPVLVELKAPDSSDSPNWYFTNNDSDVSWGGRLYKAVPMSYKQPSSQGGVPSNGTLEIIIDEQKENEELLKWFDVADDKVGASVVGIMNENGSIRKTSQFDHQHGSVSWDGRKITWNIGWDDRLQMQINPWSFTANVLIA